MKYLSLFCTCLIFVSGVLLSSCSDHNSDKNTWATPIPIKNDTEFGEGNTRTIISSEIDQLEKIISLPSNRPTRVKYKHITFDKSNQNEGLMMPGASLHVLEAILCSPVGRETNRGKNSLVGLPTNESFISLFTPLSLTK
jgi:hypothetical protein